jgi:hypothetical protein
VVVLGLKPVDALGWDLVKTSGKALDPDLEAERTIPQGANGHKPRGFKVISESAKGIAADEDFGFREVDVSHGFVLSSRFCG